MKIQLDSNGRRRGLIWLVLFIFIPAFLLAAWLAWKIIKTVRDWDYDPTHGVGDPETNLVSRLDAVRAQYGPGAVIIVPELGVTLPIEALAYEWREVVQGSTNLRDWTTEPMDWAEALENIQTNQVLPQKFYRRVLTY